MFKRAFVLALAFLFVGGAAQAAKWEIDQPHSSVGFKVSHLVISSTTGKFETFSGDIQFDSENLEAGSVSMTVDIASINTGNEKRDGHLRSGDFFDVENHPKMTFVSRKVVKGEGNEFQIVGDLTIRGVTKEVTFDCEFKGTVDFMGTTKAGFSAETTIDRQDFGVQWNKALETGGVLVGDEVDISIELELNKVG